MAGISRFIQHVGIQERFSLNTWQWALISLVSIILMIGIICVIRYIHHNEYPIDYIMKANQYINQTRTNESSV